MGPANQRAIVDRLKQTRKYGSICDDTLDRIAEWASVRHPTHREALKAAKRKLHQVYGAYLGQVDPAQIEGLVDTLSPETPEDILHATCRTILQCHVSTTERMEFVEDFYKSLFALTGRPGCVLDLGCGLNPFALPWMALDRDADYYALDIDRRTVSAINRFFDQLGRPQTAICGDIVESVPDVDADLTLLLKAVPCLEQQEKDTCARLLQHLRSRYVVVSFPAESLGGKRKGMYGYYGDFLARILSELELPAEELRYPNETFYVIDTGSCKTSQVRPDSSYPG